MDQKSCYLYFAYLLGAQAGLYYHYGVPKYPLPKKMFGVFPHYVSKGNVKLLQGFDDVFYVPHSRHTYTKKEDIEKVEDLELLSLSDESGVYIAASKDGKQIFITGHSEYDSHTLKEEYERDLSKGLPIDMQRITFQMIIHQKSCSYLERACQFTFL